MATIPKAGGLNLSEADQKQIEESVNNIRRVLRSNNRDIKSIIGLVTSADVAKTKDSVEVRFAEESTINVQMNMIAFD
ncbi:MAG: hypothetical protein Q8J76_01180 [Desulfobulbaceae bacterium]|nr:hypothetical protein [Desulfobulbaceae bacterium]